jgi:hypothetical protein
VESGAVLVGEDGAARAHTSPCLLCPASPADMGRLQIGQRAVGAE